MKHRRIIQIASLALLLGAWAPVARAEHGDDDGEGPLLRPGMLERAAEEIGIDEATLARIRDRVHEGRREGIAKAARLKEARLDLRHMLDRDEPDRRAVMKQIEDVGKLQVEMRKHRIGLLLDVRGMLTADQRTKLRKVMREHAGDGRGPHGRGRFGHGGFPFGPHGPPPPPPPPPPPGH